MDFEHPTTEPRLAINQIEYIMMHVLRKPELFMMAKKHLKPEYFTAGSEQMFKVLWEAALKIEDESKLSFMCDPLNPSAAFVRMDMEVRARILREPNCLDEAHQRYLIMDTAERKSLLSRIYSRGTFDVQHAAKLLRSFLQERAVQEDLRRLLHNAGDGVITNIPEMLQAKRDLAVSLAAIDDDPVESGAPDNWQPQIVDKSPTGLSFLDTALDGGQAPDEVYGVLGAFGSGKTSLAVQIVYNTGVFEQRQAEELTNETGEQYYPGECYLFHYEATSDEIRIRLWSSSCTIDHRHLKSADKSRLTSIKNGFHTLHPYEHDYWNTQRKYAGITDDKFMGELERLEAEIPRLKKNIWNIDCSGVPKNPKRGTGYVQEIRYIIENHLRKLEASSGRKHHVAVVAIDYAGLACKRYMAEHSKSLDHLRHYVSGFPMACKQELAIPFHCPVWVFHQLAGQSQERTMHVKQHFTDAAESKSFAENLHFCFAMGTSDENKGILQFVTSKARRAKIQDPAVLMMEGRFFRLVQSDGYVYDRIKRQVVPVDIADGHVSPPNKSKESNNQSQAMFQPDEYVDLDQD